jgi:hypothetical protein
MSNVCEFCNKSLKNIYSLKRHYIICKEKRSYEVKKIQEEKENIKCKYCNKIFSTKSSLNNHQKTAKYCLTLQHDEKNINNFECKYCKKKYTTKQVLINHVNICKDKKEILLNDQMNEYQSKIKEKDSEIKEKDKLILELKIRNNNYQKQEENFKEQIKDLQNKLDKIANKAIDRPTITNNTVNNKIELHKFPSQSEIDRKIESQFNDKYLLDGIKGVAQFVYDHIVKLEDGSIAYACFDTSRQIFKYKDFNGNEIKDPKAIKLKKMIKPGLLRQSQTLFDYFNEECDYLEKRKTNGLVVDGKEYNTMSTLRDKAFEVGCEILNIEDTNKFSTELSSLSCV